MQTLLVEDSKLIAEALEISLNNYGYSTQTKTAEMFLKSNYYTKDFDILILNIDINLPLKRLERFRTESPELCLVGLNTSNNWTRKLLLLKNGFDDVLDYPFPSQEIIIRIQNILRRPKNTGSFLLTSKDLQIDTQAKRVMHNRSEIQLRKKEFCLLEYLIRNKNRTVSRNELLDHVWDYTKINNSNTVDVHIKRLRDKIRDRNIIQTVHGFGYRLKE